MGKIWNTIKDSVKQTAAEQKAKFNKPENVDANGLEVKNNNDDDLFQDNTVVELEQDENGAWNEPDTTTDTTDTTTEPEPEPEPEPKKEAGDINNVSMKDMINNISDSTDLKSGLSNKNGLSLVPDGMNIPGLNVDTRKDINGTDTTKENNNDKSNYHVEDKDKDDNNDLPDVKLDLSKMQLPSLLMPKNLMTEEQKKVNNDFILQGIKNRDNKEPAPTEFKQDENGNIEMYFHKGDEPKPIDKEEMEKAEQFLGKEKVDALNESAREALDKGKISYVDENGQTVTKDFNIDKQLEAIKKGGEVDANYDLTQRGKYERAKNIGNMLRKVLVDPNVDAATKEEIKKDYDALRDAVDNGDISPLEYIEEKYNLQMSETEDYAKNIQEEIDDNNKTLAELNLKKEELNKELAELNSKKNLTEEDKKKLEEIRTKNAELKEAYEKAKVENKELEKEYYKYTEYIYGKGDSWKGDPVFEDLETLKGIKEKYQKQLDDFKAEYGEASKEIEKNLVEAKDVSKQKSIIVEDYKKKIENHKKDEPKNKTSKRHEEWEKQLNILEGNLVDAQGEYDRVADIVTETENNLNEVNNQVADMQSKLDETNEAIETKTKEIETKEEELEKIAMMEPQEPQYLAEPKASITDKDLERIDAINKELEAIDANINATNETITGNQSELDEYNEVINAPEPTKEDRFNKVVDDFNEGYATPEEAEILKEVYGYTKEDFISASPESPDELVVNKEARENVEKSLDFVNSKYDEIKAEYDRVKKAGGVLTRKQKKELQYWQTISAEMNQQIGQTAAEAAFVAASAQDKNDYNDKNVFQKVGEWFDDKRLAKNEKELMELAYKATGESINANPAMLSKMTDTQLAILSTPAGAKKTIDSIVESPEMYEGAKIGWETTKQVFKEIGQMFGTESVGETLFDLTMTGQRVYDRKQYAEAIDALFDMDFDTFKNLSDKVISEYELQSGENNLEGTEGIRYYMEQADANIGTPGKIKNITKMSAGLVMFVGGGFVHPLSVSASMMNNGLKAMINGSEDLFYSFEDKLDDNVRALGSNINDLNDIITKPEQVEQVKQTIQGGISPDSLDILGSMFDPDKIKQEDTTEDTTTTIIDETEQFNPGEGLTKVEEEELRKGFNRGLKEKTNEVVSDMDVKKFIRVNYKSDPLLKMIDWRK